MSQLTLTHLVLCIVVAVYATKELPEKPNIIIIFGDDVGYGDLNVYGHPTSFTPSLNRMAKEGLRMFQFYSAAPVCSPSRASLMTGRLYPRTGVYAAPTKGMPTGLSAFTAEPAKGMLLSEITIAEALRGNAGYATGMLGKWHLGLGEKQQYMPINRGFGSYYGLPLTQALCSSNIWHARQPGKCMVFENRTIVAQPADVLNLDATYVNETKRFVTAHRDEPFFFYFASHHTHQPQWASPSFQNTTRRGLFGDSLAELDWSVGQILDHLVETGIENRTLVVFTSDNGPALFSQKLGGEQGPLKCGKGTTYEGGVREPAIFWWPSVIEPGRVSRVLASTLDIFPTAMNLAGVNTTQLSGQPISDGYDLTKVLTGESSDGPRSEMFYYSGVYLMAARYGAYKAHFWTMGSHCKPSYHDSDCWDKTPLRFQNPPLLFNVEEDPKERHPLDARHALYRNVMSDIVSLVKKHNETMTFGGPQIVPTQDRDAFPCCSPSCSPRPSCCACSKGGNGL